MLKILIADDEDDIRAGIRRIIDWKSLGFIICGEAENGTDTLEKIRLLNPDLVLLDIRMPGFTGIQIIEEARNSHFQGNFIIISGYSDFSYAQSAIRLEVSNYLLKPLDEDELTDAVLQVRDSIEQTRQKGIILNQYRENARQNIFTNFITGQADVSTYDLNDLNLTADQYMIVTYEKYNLTSFMQNWNFVDLLKVSNQGESAFEDFFIDNRHVLLLKGSRAITKFYHVLEHYKRGTEKDSPLDSIFIIYGRPVHYIYELRSSYQDVVFLSKRRFFCEPNQHFLSYLDSNIADYNTSCNADLADYPDKLSGYIQSNNTSMLQETLHNLKLDLISSNLDTTVIKRKLIDIFLQIKQVLYHTYYNAALPFPRNDTIIETIMQKYYLYEIIDFFSEQFILCMQIIINKTGEDIMDDVLYYIDHNYATNIKLESIAFLFGYNSSYLGKVFTKKVGENFNTYLDRIRIENAKNLLADPLLKVYEISEKIGYKNPDYFYKKFKKYTGITPLEYRKDILPESIVSHFK